ncbi:hypothetical protein D3C84_814030 [compost metagenome]
MEDQPGHDADQHDPPRAEGLGQHTGAPAGQGCEQAVHGEQQRSLGRGETEVDDVPRQESQLDAVPCHE